MVQYVPKLSFCQEMIYSLAHNGMTQMAPLQNQNSKQINKVQKRGIDNLLAESCLFINKKRNISCVSYRILNILCSLKIIFFNRQQNFLHYWLI
jgi:hypothetical protein